MSWGMQQSSQRNDLLASIANDEAIQTLIREAQGPVVAAATSQQNGTVYYNTHPHASTPPPPPPPQQQQQQQQYYYYQQQLQGAYNSALHNAAAAAVVQQQFYGYQPNLPVYPVIPQQYQQPPPPPPPALHHSLNGRQPYRQYYMKRNSSAPSFRRQNPNQYPNQSNSFSRRTPRASHSRKQSRDNKLNLSQQTNGKEEGIEMVQMERSATVSAAVPNGTEYERYDFDSDKVQANGVVSQPPLQKSEIDDEQTDIVIVDLSNQVKNQNLEKPKDEADLKNQKEDKNQDIVEPGKDEAGASLDVPQSCADKLPADLEIEDVTAGCKDAQNVDANNENQAQDENQFVGLSTACADNLPADLDITDEVGFGQEEVEVEVHVTTEVEDKEEDEVEETKQPGENVENTIIVKEEEDNQNLIVETTDKENMEESTQTEEAEVQHNTDDSVAEKVAEVSEAKSEEVENSIQEAQGTCQDSAINEVQVATEDISIQKIEKAENQDCADQAVEEQHQVADTDQQITSNIQDESTENNMNETEQEDTNQDTKELQQSLSFDAFGLPDDLSAVAIETKVGDLPVNKSQSVDNVTMDRSQSVDDIPVDRSQSLGSVSVSDSLPESPKKSEKKKKGWFSGLWGKKNKNKNAATINQDNAATLQLQVEDLESPVIGSESSQSAPETSSDAAPVQEEQVDVNQNASVEPVSNEVVTNSEQETSEQQIQQAEGENLSQDKQNQLQTEEMENINNINEVCQKEQEAVVAAPRPRKPIPAPPPLPPKRIDRSHPGDVSTIASRFNIPDKPLVPKITKTTSYLRNDSVGVNMGMRRASTMTRKASVENCTMPAVSSLTKMNSVSSTISSTHSSHEKNDEDVETEIFEENRIQKLMKGWKEGAPVKAKAVGEEDVEEEETVVVKQIPENGARKLPPRNENISGIRDMFKAKEQSFLQKRAQKMGSEDLSGVKGAVQKFDVPPPKPAKNTSFGQALSKFKEETKLNSPKETKASSPK